MKSKKQLPYQFDACLEPENKQKSEKNQTTLKDLCPEDKVKIGQLIRKLADEKGEKETLLKVIDDTKRQYEEKIILLQQGNYKLSQCSQSNVNVQKDLISFSIIQERDSLTEPQDNDNHQNKSNKLQKEIQELDHEILGLLQVDAKEPMKGVQQANQQSISKVQISVHQSPNFKTLLPKSQNVSEKKQNYEVLFKQQLQCEPSPSFLQSQLDINYLNGQSLISKRDQMMQTSLVTPIKEQLNTLLIPNSNLNSIIEPSFSNESSVRNKENSSSKQKYPSKSIKSNDKKRDSKKKKQILMEKIGEFEKIIQRMSFSQSSHQESSFDNSQNSSTIKGVYQKIMDLEEQFQRMQIKNDQPLIQHSIKPQPIVKNQTEDDLLIELLNSTQCGLNKAEQQHTPQDEISIRQSEYNSSFFSLLDNIEVIETSKKQTHLVSIPSSSQRMNTPQQDPNEYFKGVVGKYNDLIKEIRKEFVKD